MTDHAITQELRFLLQKEGWQHLMEMMVAILRNGLPLIECPGYSAQVPLAEPSRLSNTRNAVQQLLEVLQESSLCGSRQVGTRELDKTLCDELGQVIAFIESSRRRAKNTAPQHRSRNSDSAVLNLNNNVQTNASVYANNQSNVFRYDNAGVANLQNNMSAAMARGTYPGIRNSQMSWMPLTNASTFQHVNPSRAQIAPHSPIDVSAYVQQRPLSTAHGPNGASTAPSQAFSLERYRSPPIAYAESASGSSIGSSQLVANPMPNTVGPSVHSPLHSTFKLRSQKFFKIGRVFMVLWTEPEGNDRYPSSSKNSTYSFVVAYGERAQAKIRRFIVIAQLGQHSLAIPILSYQNNGVAKKGVNKADHGIVHMGARVPEPGPDELPKRGEKGMVPIAIRIIPDEITERLADTSRINYGKIYTIEHNVKAKGVGMVHEASLRPLLQQHQQVLMRANPQEVRETMRAEATDRG